MNKIVFGFIVKKLRKLVIKFGISMVLQALVDITGGFPETSMVDLSKDLAKALANYKKNTGK